MASGGVVVTQFSIVVPYIQRHSLSRTPLNHTCFNETVVMVAKSAHLQTALFQ